MGGFGFIARLIFVLFLSKRMDHRDLDDPISISTFLTRYLWSTQVKVINN